MHCYSIYIFWGIEERHTTNTTLAKREPHSMEYAHTLCAATLYNILSALQKQNTLSQNPKLRVRREGENGIMDGLEEKEKKIERK